MRQQAEVAAARARAQSRIVKPKSFTLSHASHNIMVRSGPASVASTQVYRLGSAVSAGMRLACRVRSQSSYLAVPSRAYTSIHLYPPTLQCHITLRMLLLQLGFLCTLRASCPYPLLLTPRHPPDQPLPRLPPCCRGACAARAAWTTTACASTSSSPPSQCLFLTATAMCRPCRPPSRCLPPRA